HREDAGLHRPADLPGLRVVAEDRVGRDRVAQPWRGAGAARIGGPALHARGDQRQTGPRGNDQPAADEPVHHAPSTTSYFQPRNVPVSWSETWNGTFCSGAGAVIETTSVAIVVPPSPRIENLRRTG